MACFYIEYDNLNAHRKVINFFLENNLIPKTKNGRYYDVIVQSTIKSDWGRIKKRLKNIYEME